MKKHKGKLQSAITIRQLSILIPILRQRDMAAREIEETLRMDPNRHTYNYERIRNLLVIIGDSEPLFEPIPGRFKILTDNDLEEYRELQRRQEPYAQRYDMA